MFYMETSAKETGQGQQHIIYKHPAQAIGRTPRLSSTAYPSILPYGRICLGKGSGHSFLTTTTLQTLLDEN